MSGKSVSLVDLQSRNRPSVPGTRKWDRHAIDTLLNAFSGIGDSYANRIIIATFALFAAGLAFASITSGK
jgi:hypothetical protein